MNNQEIQFHKMLNQLASLTPNFEMDEHLIELYDRHLEPFGYSVVNQALESIIAERNSRDPFPSIKEIRSVVEKQVPGRSLAMDTAARILGACQRHGYTWSWGQRSRGVNIFEARTDSGEFRAFKTFEQALELECGEIAIHVVRRMGGWSAVCEEWQKGKDSIFRAQLRDLSEAILEQHKAGRLEKAPELPSTQKQQISAPVKNLISESLGEKGNDEHARGK